MWTPRARRDRDSIHARIARDNPAHAYAVVTAIVTAINRLADFPLLGRLGRKAGTRDLVLARFPYVVLYRVRDDRVEILHIQHMARNR